MAAPRTATADQLNRARKLADDAGHTVADALDIIIEHDRKIARQSKRGRAAAEAIRDWSTGTIHGLDLEDQEAAAHAEVLGYFEELLTGKAPQATEDQVERSIIDYVFLKGGTYIERLDPTQPVPDGTLVLQKTSQKQKPLGMSKGLSDLVITRAGVWLGWYQLEVKARGPKGKIAGGSKISDEQRMMAEAGLSTIVWHVAQVAVVVYTLDKHFGYQDG